MPDCAIKHSELDMNETDREIIAVTARAKRRFPDHVLDIAFPACLPVYEVSLTVTTMVEDKLSTTARFILRLLKAGETRPEEIGRLLGLPVSYVAGAAAELLGQDLAIQRPDMKMEMTDVGKTCLSEGGVSLKPRNLTLKVPYDPLTKSILDVHTEQLLDRDLVRKQGLYVARAKPRPPRMSNIRLDEVKDYARSDARFQEKRDVLEVTAIKWSRLRYRNDVILVKLDSVNSRNSTYAAYRAQQYLEDESAAIQTLSERGVELVPEDLKKVDALPWKSSISVTSEESEVLSAIDELDQAVSANSRVIEETRETQKATQSVGERTELAQRIKELEAESKRLTDRLHEQENQLKSLTDEETRLVKTEEHRHLLLEAIRKAQSELTLVSAWINSEALDDEVRRALATTINGGTKVRIAWGLGVNGGRGSEATRNRARGNNALNELRKLIRRERRQNLTVKLTQTHEKFIICDDLFCAFGSFNWLSYRGLRDRGYRRETSFYSERKTDVDLWKANAETLFNAR